MKKLILFSIAVLVAGFANAQQVSAADVPTPVKSFLHEKYPKATVIKWSKKSKGELEAEFESEGRKMSVNFSSTGIWLGTETVVKSSDLSKAIRAVIAKQFAGYKLMKTQRAEAPGKPFVYETDLEKGKVTVEVTFSIDGKVIKKEEKKMPAVK